MGCAASSIVPSNTVPKAEQDYGSITLEGNDKTYTIPLKNKLFCNYLVEDLLPVIGLKPIRFGSFLTACVIIESKSINTNGEIIRFDYKSRIDNVVKKIKNGTKFTFKFLNGKYPLNSMIPIICNAAIDQINQNDYCCSICENDITDIIDYHSESAWMSSKGYIYHHTCMKDSTSHTNYF